MKITLMNHDCINFVQISRGRIGSDDISSSYSKMIYERDDFLSPGRSVSKYIINYFKIKINFDFGSRIINY